MRNSVAIVISGALIALAIVSTGIYQAEIFNSTESAEGGSSNSLSELSNAIRKVADLAFQISDSDGEVSGQDLQVAAIGHELRVTSCVVENLDGRSVNEIRQSCRDGLESNVNND